MKKCAGCVERDAEFDTLLSKYRELSLEYEATLWDALNRAYPPAIWDDAKHRYEKAIDEMCSSIMAL